VTSDAYRHEFGRTLGDDFPTELRSMEEIARDGLVVLEAGDGFSVTPIGSLLLRNLAMIFDAYLPDQLDSGRPMFSKTV
jgi:oxygen-independent coproporphyrinogen-3 oxidase